MKTCRLNILTAIRKMTDDVSKSTFVHYKCRNTEKPYYKSKIFRVRVPDDKVAWEVNFENYSPVDYTDDSIRGKDWSDGDIKNGHFKWNEVDDQIDRRSYYRRYKISEDDGRPLNPFGRTGLKGRGVLGRWGPNHAADPIVSRFLNGQLQFVAIQRRDTNEWAIPGGMVDKGESVSDTLKREFTEEALDGIDDSTLEELWSKGKSIFKGYVDDPRNTDNSWMETKVVNFHDDAGLLANAKIKAGDDAINVKFVDVKPGIELYASHEFFIRKFAKLHGVDI